MIIVKLMGGLGNQMFQYAAGRCLAHLHKTELKLDLSYLEADPQNKYTKRHYALDVFNINAAIATESDIKPFLPLYRNKYHSTLQRKLPILFSKIVANESGHAFIKEFYSFPKSTYLNGFWQSELYFQEIREILLNEFTIKQEPDAANLALAEKIKSLTAVSLHIRRGDYVTNKETSTFHGSCSLAYYHQAISYIKTVCESAHLFVFSDDVAWAKANLNSVLPVTYIDINQGKPQYDIWLMSLCKHHIIANSSFSWWGAWLNPYANKMVIAPTQWFAGVEAHSHNIYPEKWIIM